MPLVPGARALIELPVADRKIADTLVRQRARFISLFHYQTASGEGQAIITVEITLYAADGNGFGPALTGQGFIPYRKELSTDNQTVVDAATGEILAIRIGESETDWQQKLASYTQNVMLQGDFFEFLRDNAPVQIGAMIRQYIQQADAAGRFA